jgi:hypothetical protein
MAADEGVTAPPVCAGAPARIRDHPAGRAGRLRLEGAGGIGMGQAVKIHNHVTVSAVLSHRLGLIDAHYPRMFHRCCFLLNGEGSDAGVSERRGFDAEVGARGWRPPGTAGGPGRDEAVRVVAV